MVSVNKIVAKFSAAYFVNAASLTHLPLVPHICVSESSNRVNIGSDNGLSPIQHQAII